MANLTKATHTRGMLDGNPICIRGKDADRENAEIFFGGFRDETPWTERF
jgi:hypothetical protein